MRHGSQSPVKPPAKAGAADGKAPSRRSAPRSKAGPAAPGTRQLRVAEEIRHVLAGIFARDPFRDPDLADVRITVTEVRISPDLRNATAFVTRLGRSDVAAALPALTRAAPFLRGEVARVLKLRLAPTLSFQADATLDYAMHVDALLRQPAVARDLTPAVPRDLANDE